MVKNPNSWFKLYTKITEWGWFKDAKTLQIFILILASAQIEKSEFLGVTIERGQLATSYPKLSQQSNSSLQETRTAIKHLILTGEITVTRHSKFSVITVVNYDRYQAKQQSNQHSTNSQLTVNQHSLNTINRIYKKEDTNVSSKKKRKKEGAAAPESSPQEWEREIPEEFWGEFESLEDFKRWWES